MRTSLLIIFAATALVVASLPTNEIISSDEDDYAKALESLTQNQAYVEDYAANVEKLLEIEPNYFNYTPFDDNYKFDCDVNYADDNQTSPTSVHKLRPIDVKVVGALGDSITAAAGLSARTALGLIIEHRGRSWSIGGDKELEQVVTLPNFLRKFKAQLKGYANGWTFPKLKTKKSGLNVAVSGDEAANMPEQAEELIEKMKSNPKIDFQNDWKMITLFIGGNDLCRVCKNEALHTPKVYISEIQRALDILHERVPRAFINLVPILRIEQVKELNIGLVCSVLHQFLCKCAAFPVGNQEDIIREFTASYQFLIEQLASSGRYDSRDDFTVVSQPLMTTFEVPRTPSGQPDVSYLAPDCFHFSAKGHAAASIALWNNLLQPIGQKATTWKPEDKILCPTKEQPYFFTSKNSN